MKTKFFAFIIALCAFALATSCQKDEHFSETAPTVPGISTLKIDFPDLHQMETKGIVEDSFRYLYKTFVDIWMNLYENMLNVPMGALEIVGSAEPTYDGGVWTWNISDYNCIGQKYAVALAGTETQGKVDWALSVSRDGIGGFQNYTWLEGWSEKDGSAGQWSVRVSPDDVDVVVTSDWTAENGRLLTCRNTYSLEHALGGIGAFFNGSYVEYSASATDERFNNSLKISYFQIGNLEIALNLEWNPETNKFRTRMNGGKWME